MEIKELEIDFEYSGDLYYGYVDAYYSNERDDDVGYGERVIHKINVTGLLRFVDEENDWVRVEANKEVVSLLFDMCEDLKMNW
jgi:hypothetical protein